MPAATRRPAKLRLAGVLLLAMAASLAHAGADDARAWIQRMNEAVVKRNYDGVFTQRIEGKSEVLRILHRYKDGEMIERVISTDGSGYEQKRKGARWAEFHPDKRMVLTQTRTRSFGYLPTINAIETLPGRHYDIRDAGRVRLDGREVQQIHLLPRDALRYGFRFWLDAETALPLKFQRVSNDGKVLRDISFVNAPRLPEEIADDALMVELDFKGFRWVDSDRYTPMHNPALKRAYSPQRSMLPPGYRSVIFNSPAEEAKAPGMRARFIVTDGLSWADVFVAPAATRGQGSSFIDGPITSYQLRIDDVMVTVVGEMPEAAAQAIAQAVRPE